MTKAYISISFKNRKNLKEEINTIKQVLEKHNIIPMVFVDDYDFGPDQVHEMMQQACADIKTSDLLIAELSEKAIGVGLEVGYAAALNKPVIYLKNIKSEYSKTVGGLCNETIEYSDVENLQGKLDDYLNSHQN